MGKTSIQRKGKGDRRETQRGPCLGVTAGGPGVGRGTQNSEAVQASRNLIAVAAFLSFPKFNHLPRSFLPFKFGIPNARARLSGRHSGRNGKPRHTQ
ncbi:MAG: hypothetical protein DMG84_23585 [Acidobacteria bacterium]|nr:MAG: hypothetical protein DMG84_23585 [Acidobacteriota bacterium]